MSDNRYVWSVATGYVNPLIKRSRQAVKFLSEQPGFIGVHPTPDGRATLWFYDTENNAKGARNMARTKGIECGKNICRFRWGDGMELVFDDPNYKET